VPVAKNKTHYRLLHPCDILRYNTSKRIVLVGLKNLTIQLCQKALLEPEVPVPKQRLPDCEEWQVSALKPQPHRADLLLPVSPVLV
jgi:hypothetical protein